MAPRKHCFPLKNLKGVPPLLTNLFSLRGFYNRGKIFNEPNAPFFSMKFERG